MRNSTSIICLLVLLQCADIIVSFTPLVSNHRMGTNSVLFAKKKGGKKNKNKKSGFEWATSFVLKPFEAKVTRELATTATASFEGRTGKPLDPTLQGSADLPKSLWNAPIACIVVGKNDNETNEEGSTTELRYANVAALETVGLNADEYEKFIVGMSADPSVKPTVFVDLAAEMKGDTKYEGRYNKCIIRSEVEEEKVTILNAQRWVLERSALIDGKFVTETMGVAYAWTSWQLGENLICSPGGIQMPKMDLENIEKAIESKAAFIRDLKEVQGFGNKDPEVLEAVTELKQLKALQSEQLA